MNVLYFKSVLHLLTIMEVWTERNLYRNHQKDNLTKWNLSFQHLTKIISCMYDKNLASKQWIGDSSLWNCTEFKSKIIINTLMAHSEASNLYNKTCLLCLLLNIYMYSDSILKKDLLEHDHDAVIIWVLILFIWECLAQQLTRDGGTCIWNGRQFLLC